MAVHSNLIDSLEAIYRKKNQNSAHACSLITAWIKTQEEEEGWLTPINVLCVCILLITKFGAMSGKAGGKAANQKHRKLEFLYFHLSIAHPQIWSNKWGCMVAQWQITKESLQNTELL